MVDAADHLRIKVAKNELDLMLSNIGLRQREVPILVYANKMDLSSAMTAVEVSQSLELFRITDRPWHIQACSALQGDGIDSGMNWLSDIIKRNKK